MFEKHIRVLDLASLALTSYSLVADPTCPICAPEVKDAPETAVVSLSSRPKHAVSDYRLMKPCDYDLPVHGYLNPVCGMLGATAFADHLHTVDAPVFGKFYTQVGDHPYQSYWAGRGGVYRTSRCMGLLEGLERYVGLLPRATKRGNIFECYEALRPNALDPRRCGLHQPECYRVHAPKLVPFDPQLKVSWVWGYSFREARPILVPEQLAYYGVRGAHSPLFVDDTSNGCASGSSLEEAMLFGLWELIERDGMLLTWYATLSLDRIDPMSSRNPHTFSLLDRIGRLGYDVHLIDTRFDLPVPSVLYASREKLRNKTLPLVACQQASERSCTSNSADSAWKHIAVAVSRAQGPGMLVLGGGAGFDPEAAIHTAVCEVGTSLSGFAARIGESLDKVRAMVDDYSKVTELEDHALIYGLPAMAEQASFLYRNPRVCSVETCYASWLKERPGSLDLRDDLNYCINELISRGIDVVVVDQTSPEEREVGLSTVKVIVPGLLPISFGWGKERIIDLPRLKTAPRLGGYLTADFDPSRCNRVPHPLS